MSAFDELAEKVKWKPCPNHNVSPKATGHYCGTCAGYGRILNFDEVDDLLFSALWKKEPKWCGIYNPEGHIRRSRAEAWYLLVKAVSLETLSRGIGMWDDARFEHPLDALCTAILAGRGIT